MIVNKYFHFNLYKLIKSKKTINYVAKDSTVYDRLTGWVNFCDGNWEIKNEESFT